MKKNLAKILQILIIMLVCTSNVAFAFTTEQRRELELRTFYDPTDGTSCGVGGAVGTFQGLAGKVYMIGDSITEGTYTELNNAFSTKGLTSVDINGKSSRRLSEGGTDLDGMTVLANDKTTWSDANTIVVALGTNGGVSSTNVKKTIDTIKAGNSSAKIYWVNIGVDNNKRNGADINADAINSALASSASTLGFTMIDWSGAVKTNTGYISSDGLGVHPFTASGKKGFADVVTNALATVTPTPATTSETTDLSNVGGTNPQKIYSYFIGRGLTPIQTAGIMGNLQAESGFNPGVEEKGTARKDKGYGIAQWTFGRRTNLESFASGKGKPASDLGVQLDFLWSELNGAYKTKVLDVIKGTASLEVATYVFLEKFEVPANIEGNKPIRLGFAQNVLSQPWIGNISGDVFASSGSCDSDSAAATGSGTPQFKIVNAAQKELANGASESDTSPTSDKSYLKYTNGTKIPWCAAFLSWVLKESGVPFDGGGNGGWYIPSVDGVRSWYESKGTFKAARSGYTPVPGDTVIMKEGKSPYPSHVNIVISVEGNTITTIGGNEGNTIKKHTHQSYDAAYITGFGQNGGISGN